MTDETPAFGVNQFRQTRHNVLKHMLATREDLADLEYIIIYHSELDLNCADPRDGVYSLLSLSIPGTRQRLAIVPD